MKYNHKYLSCTRTYSSLRIHSKHIHPDVITDLLKVKPTEITVAGTTCLGGRKHINGWYLSTKGKLKSKDSRRHIDWILDKIEAASKEIKELQKQGVFMDIPCYWGSASGNGGPTISPVQMARLVVLNLEVWWDVYFEGDDNEADAEDGA